MIHLANSSDTVTDIGFLNSRRRPTLIYTLSLRCVWHLANVKNNLTLWNQRGYHPKSRRPGGTWIHWILRILALRQYCGYRILRILMYCGYSSIANTGTRAVLRILVSMYCGYSAAVRPTSQTQCAHKIDFGTDVFSGLYHGMGLLGTFECMCGQLETHFRCG